LSLLFLAEYENILPGQINIINIGDGFILVIDMSLKLLSLASLPYLP
jgi:hypothetical protein